MAGTLPLCWAQHVLDTASGPSPHPGSGPMVPGDVRPAQGSGGGEQHHLQTVGQVPDLENFI